MNKSRIRRPTEAAALAAVARRPRKSPSIPALYADMTTAHRLGDREGFRLLACQVVRATSRGVGE